MDNVEGAEVAGDPHPTARVLTADGVIGSCMPPRNAVILPRRDERIVMADTETPRPRPEPDAYIAAAAALLAIPLDPAWEAAIGANLTVLRGAADLVAGFALGDEVEAAPVFAA